MTCARCSGTGKFSSKEEGKGKELTKVEFFRRAALRTPNEDLRLLFSQVDVDKSGGLSAQEMQAYYNDTKTAAKERPKQLVKSHRATS